MKIVFIKNDGSTIAIMETYFPDIKAKDTIIFNVSTEIDITNADNYYIQKN